MAQLFATGSAINWLCKKIVIEVDKKFVAKIAAEINMKFAIITVAEEDMRLTIKTSAKVVILGASIYTEMALIE